jgi:RecA/RadA recombinase
MTFHYKGEYAERNMLAQRASKFNIYLHKLHRLAVTKKIAVVIMNHATNKPDENLRYSIPKPFGGNIMSHASKYMINLDGKGSGSIMATLASHIPTAIVAVLVLS